MKSRLILVLCWTLASCLQLEEKNCRGLYNDLHCPFYSFACPSYSLAIHTARCCQHLLPWFSSTFTSTTCSNMYWCVSLMQVWKKSSITYTCSPSWLNLLLNQLSVNMDRSKVMVCPPRTWWPWGQELPALNFPRQNDGDGMWWAVEQTGFAGLQNVSFRDIRSLRCFGSLPEEN